MPRVIPTAEKMRAINLMLSRDNSGNYAFGQRDIERETGLSRPYLRKLAKEIGHQFPRNGIEVKGQMCMCTNCGFLFRKPPSRVVRAKKQFCDEECKTAYMKGVNHPSWRHGKTAATFSTWVKNQSQYDRWREEVLARDGHMCQISGRTDDLAVHHVLPKAELYNPEKAFDPGNGMTLNREVHERIHAVIRNGHEFERAIEIVRAEYGNKVSSGSVATSVAV